MTTSIVDVIVLASVVISILLTALFTLLVRLYDRFFTGGLSWHAATLIGIGITSLLWLVTLIQILFTRLVAAVFGF